MLDGEKKLKVEGPCRNWAEKKEEARKNAQRFEEFCPHQRRDRR